MKETLRRSTTDFFKDINSAKRRLNTLQDSMNSVREIVDKFEQRLREVEIEILEFQGHVEKSVRREYNDKMEALKRENSELLRIINKYAFGEADETVQEVDVESEATVRAKQVASTLSILEKYIDLIYDGEDSFRLISRAVLVPNIYEKLLLDGGESYYLDKVPDCIDDLIREGREFRAKIFSKVNTNLRKESAWDQCIDEVEEWWKGWVLPMIYGFEGGEEQNLFDNPPHSLEQAKEWDHPETREEKYAFSFDAMNQMNRLRGEVAEINGITALNIKYHTHLQGGAEPALLAPSLNKSPEDVAIG